MVDNRATATAVKKQLYKLRDGYEGPADPKQVARYGAVVGSVIECYDSLPRAMEQGRMQIREAAAVDSSYASGTTILAGTMTQCKGRFTRTWHAPRGGIWGSVVHGNSLLPESRRFIPFAVGLACCEMVRQLGGDVAFLRWVNDVLIGGKKVAGFLVESYTEPIHREEFTLIGFGINVNNEKFPPELLSSAASLKQLFGKSFDIQELTTAFLARLAWNIGLLHYEEQRVLQGKGFSGRNGTHLLLERWLHCSDTVGQHVWYGFDVMQNPQYKARVMDLDADGGLVMRLEDGHQTTEYSGEVRYIP